MQNKFEKNIKIRYSEMDCDLMLKPSALLQALQDMASENAEQLGFGYSFIIKNNLAWFLLKYHIEFNEYPHNIYDLKLVTEPRGYNKLFAFRDFELYDKEKLLARAISTWSLIDLETKNIASVEQSLGENPYMTKNEKRETDLSYEKVLTPQKIDEEKEFEVRFEDIDVNQHANNSNYIIWAFEPLSLDFRTTKVLKSLDMLFKKEIKYGAKLISEVEIQGNKTLHLLKSESGEDLCLINANWTDRK